MNCADALNRLRAHADAIKAMGATSLYLFGSTAHDSAKVASDLDLFVDYDQRGRFNAFDLVGIKLFPEKELALPQHPFEAVLLGKVQKVICFF